MKMEKVQENSIVVARSPDLNLVDYNMWEILLEEVY